MDTGKHNMNYDRIRLTLTSMPSLCFTYCYNIPEMHGNSLVSHVVVKLVLGGA